MVSVQILSMFLVVMCPYRLDLRLASLDLVLLSEMTQVRDP